VQKKNLIRVIADSFFSISSLTVWTLKLGCTTDTRARIADSGFFLGVSEDIPVFSHPLVFIMKKSILFSALAAALVLSACGKKEEVPVVAPAAVPAAVTDAATAAGAAVGAAAGAVAGAADAAVGAAADAAGAAAGAVAGAADATAGAVAGAADAASDAAKAAADAAAEAAKAAAKPAAN